jgi:tRNA-dihydrouridine synthase B
LKQKSIDSGNGFKVGSVDIPGRAFLAPMSGVSDLPFRKLALRFGASMVVSEMLACREYVHGGKNARKRAEKTGSGPHMVQIAGNEAYWMGEAAKVAEAEGADIIDINMGCPAKKVTSGYSGSALMRDLDHAITLIEATVQAVKVPVTLKMRLGWDDETINAPELAKRAEDAGIQMITVHGRTRCQFYKGKADWQAIAEVRKATGLPFIANGDVTKPEDAASIIKQTGADAVMIGRGSYGKPWLPGQAADYLVNGFYRQAPEGKDFMKLILEHYEHMLQHYGIETGLRNARKHLGWYMETAEEMGIFVDQTMKKQIMTSSEPQFVKALISQAFDSAQIEAA